MPCVVCENSTATSFYNFHTTATMHSLTPVGKFCQKIIGSSFTVRRDLEELICECCYNSINELDEMERRTKEITEDMKRRYSKKQREIPFDRKDLCLVVSLKDNLDEDESDDGKMLDLRSDSPEVQETIRSKHKNIDKIHFSNENDLKNILEVKLKEDSNNSEEIMLREEHNISVLYDMMDEKNVEILIEPKIDDTNRKPIQCKKCSEIFNSTQELKTHAASHTEERPFICEVCGKAYRHKTAFDIHVGMHNGINPFKCMYCNKSFTQKGALMRHVKIHTGEKPFQCEQCGKCFTHHTSFNIHKLSHSGEKSYECEVCGLRLISTSHLKRHMRVHTGEKKYSCTTCGKRFAERYNLVSHEKLHTTGTIIPQKKKIKCEVCGTAFPKHELEEHMMKEHSDGDVDSYMFISLNQ